MASPQPESNFDTQVSVSALRLTRRQSRIISEAQISTIGELATALTNGSLRRIKGCGPDCETAIRNAMDAYLGSRHQKNPGVLGSVLEHPMLIAIVSGGFVVAAAFFSGHFRGKNPGGGNKGNVNQIVQNLNINGDQAKVSRDEIEETDLPVNHISFERFVERAREARNDNSFGDLAHELSDNRVEWDGLLVESADNAKPHLRFYVIKWDADAAESTFAKCFLAPTTQFHDYRADTRLRIRGVVHELNPDGRMLVSLMHCETEILNQ